MLLHRHAPELAAIQIETALREAAPSAQRLHRNTALRLLQEPDDLRFRVPLLHVQPSRFGDLDSQKTEPVEIGGDVNGDSTPV